MGMILKECFGYSLHFFDAGAGKTGSDKFYRVFVYSNPNRATVIMHWGRDGTLGQAKAEYVSSYTEGRLLVEKKLTAKMKGGYEKLGEGVALLDHTVSMQTMGEQFAHEVSQRAPVKNRMTGGYLIHEEPDLLDLLS